MNEFSDLTEHYLSSESVFDGHLLHVKRDRVRLPNGAEKTRELIRHNGAACIAAVTEDGRIVMERQFRYPVGKTITELPAGKLDPGEDPLHAAQRELREETGLSAGEWISLGTYFPTPAYSDEVIHLYLARDLHTGEQKLDDDEFLNVFTVPLKEVVEEVLAGCIPDGKTQTAVLKAARILGF